MLNVMFQVNNYDDEKPPKIMFRTLLQTSNETVSYRVGYRYYVLYFYLNYIYIYAL